MLQVRISNFDGSNPIILENAKNRSVSRVINSSDEGVSFSIAKNDPKAYILSPYDEDTPSKRWEVWDTATDTRVNYGFITDIKDGDTDWTVTGTGRSSLLQDFYKTKKTFYAPIATFIDDLRFENLAAEPRTTTLVPDADLSAAEITVFGPAIGVNEKYHGLSKRTKDNAIDDENGLFKVGEIEKPNTYYTTESFWSGMSPSDTHITDLGDVYEVSKIQIQIPTWGGPQRLFNRSFDYKVYVAKDSGGTLTTVQGRVFAPFT